jgi:hypothetical protein
MKVIDGFYISASLSEEINMNAGYWIIVSSHFSNNDFEIILDNKKIHILEMCLKNKICALRISDNNVEYDIGKMEFKPLDL